MTPERWQEVERLYHATLEREESQRAAYLAQACAEDGELRREVESLLAQQTRSDEILGAPAVEAAARAFAESAGVVKIGQQLGPYKILSVLGRGGMGEVYRAQDTRLGRAVAIKFVAQQFSARFEREARSISSMNHPHICTLYDVGPNYLVMELVEGETLAVRLTRGKLSMADTLKYGAQIADALDAAHSKGIIHRDLKPQNIAIAKVGIKVLDFGLAKSPQDATLTASHVLMGTPAYMAPEQCEGKEADTRTDIYALGLMLSEMATGKRAVQGQRPAIEEIPEGLARVIERCLENDPEDRWQAAKDLKTVLEWAGEQQPSVLRQALPRWVVTAFLGLLLALAVGLPIEYLHQSGSELRSFRLDVSAPPGAEFRPDSGVAISPDGRMLAFVARSTGGDGVWIRPLNSSVARELPGTDDGTFPFWSPDSRSLAFFAAGKLQRVDVMGGLPTVICSVASGRGGTWNTDGIILFNSVNDGPLLRVSANGGTPASVTTVDVSHHENSHRWPHFLPDGRRYLYFIRSDNSGVYLGSLDRPQDKTRLVSSLSNAIYGPDANGKAGHLLWVGADGTLVTQRFDPEKGHLLGDPATVAESVALGSATRLGTVSVSNDGTLFYGSAASERRQLEWHDREGKLRGVLGQPEAYVGLRISPDGKGVALVGRKNIWQIEFARGIPARVTVGSLNVLWSPDGRRIVYTNGAPPNIFAQSVGSASPEERLTESRDSQSPLDWSPDGQFLLYEAKTNDPSSKVQADLWLLPMTGDRKPIPLTQTSFREGRSRFSPDGKWIAYTSDESGRDEVYVRNFPGGGIKLQVSGKGGDYPIWRKDGKELFYVALDSKLTSVAVRTSPRGLEFGPPSVLFHIPAVVSDPGILTYTYDVMSDGQRFLLLAPTSGADVPTMTVLTNWQAGLKR